MTQDSHTNPQPIFLQACHSASTYQILLPPNSLAFLLALNPLAPSWVEYLEQTGKENFPLE